MVLTNVYKKDGYFYIEGNSTQFNSLGEIQRFIKSSEKAKKKGKTVSGRRFWSEKLQMPFRSNWEIELAELLSDLEIKFEYEPKRFYFKAERESYLPDFWLPEYNCWVEVKGWMDNRSERRCKLFKKYHGKEYGYFLVMKEELELLRVTPEFIYKLLEVATLERQRKAKGG